VSLFSELKRRNIFKVAVAYLALGWVLVQITDVVVPALNLPDTLNSIVVYIGIIGFPIALFFAWAFELTPDGLMKTEEVDTDESIRSRTGQKINYIIIGLLSLAVIFLLFDRTSKPEPQEVIIADLANTIAVLPFEDMSADGSQDYFGRGMAEEILNVIVSIETLDVASRTSTFALNDQNLLIPEIAERLNVNFVVEGSIRSSGNRVRVTAQLIDVANDTHMWSETYDRDLTDIFAIQDEISMAIAGALKVELLGDVLGDVPTQNMEAYALYLQARQLFNIPSFQNSLKARKLANQVITLDPAYSEGWAVLADSYENSATYGFSENSREEIIKLFNLALEAANKSISLDPDLGYGWAKKGNTHLRLMEWKQAKLAFDKAIKLSANDDSDPWLDLGQYYLSVGAYENAIEVLATAKDINPDDSSIYYSLGYAFIMDTNTEKTHMEFENAISKGVANVRSGNVILSVMEGNKEEIARNFEGFHQRIEAPASKYTDLYIDAYFKPDLRENYREYLSREPKSTASLMYASLLGDGNYIVNWLKNSVGFQSIMFQRLYTPPFRAILNQLVMKEYLHEVGLVDHWREVGFPNFCRPVGDDDFDCGEFE
jgi:adenylate cyclase